MSSDITNKNITVNDVLEDIVMGDADGVADNGDDVANKSAEVNGVIGKKRFSISCPNKAKIHQSRQQIIWNGIQYWWRSHPFW